MALVNLSLLLGGGLFMAVPIVLHLIMRQQPKRIIFPALRFVKERKEANTRKMQLRHWLLLSLRCLAIAALGACLARPSVASTEFGNWLLVGGIGILVALAGLLTLATAWNRSGKALLAGFGITAALLAVAFLFLLGTMLASAKTPLAGDRKAPAAAVIIVDTASRMQYRQENKTRLEAAQELAAWVLKQLPDESDIAVMDARPGLAAFAVDRAAATQSIARLQTTGAGLPLTTVLREALRLVTSSDKKRQEIYVFTDLAAGAWDDDATRGLQDQLAKAPQVALYLIDVGVVDPQNFSLGELRLSAESLPQSSQLTIETDISRLGPTGDRAVELLLEEPNDTRPIIVDGKPLLPEAKVRSRQAIHLVPGVAQGVRFQLGKLPLGVHHGRVRIVGDDALSADDTRYFTLSVEPAWKVLVVAPADVSATAWTEAIAPYEFRQTGQARFDAKLISQADLTNQRLNEFAAVFLLDPGPLAPPQWTQLAEYAQQGGGVGIFLGHNADAASFSSVEAQNVLPAKLAAQVRAPEGIWLDPRSLEHPILAEFRTDRTTVPWRNFPVFRYWSLKDIAAEASTIVPFSDGRPAIVERPLGRGRMVLLTTPVSDTLRPRGRTPWNELSIGEDAWPFFILANEISRYLVSSGQARLNYLAGDNATLSNPPERFPERFQLFPPNDDPYEVAARDGQLAVRFTDLPGAYRLKGQWNNRPLLRGFSTNLPLAATDLTRLSPEQLDERLGKSRYHLARTQEEIEFSGEDRAGREFYPWLVLIVALVLAGEHVLANRFYRPERAEAARVEGR